MARRLDPRLLGFAAAALFGAGLRLAHYLDRRPLWLDECMLALNVAARGLIDLLRPLDYNQVAPPLFLWVERLSIALFGIGELALRAPSFAAGLALLVLMGPVARPLLGPVGAVAGAALAALSPILIRYANEAKPYGTDAMLSVALVGMALRVVGAPTARWRWLALGATGVLAILLSIPAVFVVGGVVAALALHPSTRPRARSWTALGAAWALAVAAVYFGVYLSAATNPVQHQGYERAFLRPGPRLVQDAVLAAQGTLLPVVAGDGAGIPGASDAVAWLVGLGALAGAGWLARRHGAWAPVLVGGPLLLAALASSLRRYPLGVPRMMAFAAPLIILMMAAAVAALAETLRGHVRPVLAAAAGTACLAPMALGRVEAARRPWRGEDAVALVDAFRERPRPHEPVYVGARGIPSWVFYTTNWRQPNRERLAFYARAASGTGPSFENLAPRARVVREEGGDLVYTYRNRREILGLAPGSQWRWPAYLTRTPDAGWAINEAGRIVREANPCAWLYFTHVSDGSARPITWVLRDDHRGQRLFHMVVPGGVLMRYCFAYTPQQLEELRQWHEQRATADAGRPEPEEPPE